VTNENDQRKADDKQATVAPTLEDTASTSIDVGSGKELDNTDEEASAQSNSLDPNGFMPIDVAQRRYDAY